MQNSRVKLIFGTLLVIVLLVILPIYLFVASYVTYRSDSDFRKTATETTEAVITHVDESQLKVYVHFFVNGIEYSGHLGFYSESMWIGDTVKIRYNPDNPQDFRSANGNRIQILMMCGVGLFFVLVDILLIRDRIKRAA